MTRVLPRWTSPIRTADGRVLPSHGEKVCTWIESNCVFGEGDWLGQPVRLQPEQKRFLWRLYEYWPATGERRYTRALRGMAKGAGKSPIAGCVGAYELMGQVHAAPRVIIGAASLKQANLVFGDMRQAIAKSPTLGPLADCLDLEIELRDEDGVAERIAAVAGANDGARATCFIADELHEWTGRLERVFLIVEGAISKRVGAFTLSITTAGSDLESECGRQYELGKQLATGELVDDSVLFEWWEAPALRTDQGHEEDGLDVEDPEQWEIAVRAANPNLGVFASLENVRSRWEGAKRIPRHEFFRYYFNRWTRTQSEWIPAAKWKSRALERQLLPHQPVVLGFRGSYDNRSAAIIGSTEDGHLFEVGVWDDEADLDYQVPRLEVETTLEEAMRTYRVRRLCWDPPGWHEEGERWSETWGQRVAVRSESRRTTSFTADCGRFYTAALTGTLSHDGGDGLTRHVKNAQPRPGPGGTYIVSGRQEASGAFAAVLAYSQAKGTKKGGTLVGVTV